MRILLVNNFWRDVGGVERVVRTEHALLRDHGHTVAEFSTAHPDNWPSPFTKYFVSSVDFQAGGSWIKKIERLFFSREVARQLRALLRDHGPFDVAHVHGVFDTLGPTVLWELKRAGVPIIFTAHAYKLICPNWKLFARGRVDESCAHRPFADFWNRSIQNSWIKSFGGALAWALHRRWGTFNLMDRIISPSQFLIEKHVARGWAREKFVHLPNPVDVMAYNRATGDGAFALFVGRLVPEKGVEVLVRAAALAAHVPVIIVGDGPERERLQKMARVCGASNISFVGRKTPAEVADFVAGARAVVVPSIWFENDSLAVLEAQAQARVVIASHIGGIPEQIRHGETGFLCASGDAAALAQVLVQVWSLAQEQRAAIGVRARAAVDVVRNPELYYEELLGIFCDFTPKLHA